MVIGLQRSYIRPAVVFRTRTFGGLGGVAWTKIERYTFVTAYPVEKAWGTGAGAGGKREKGGWL